MSAVHARSRYNTKTTFVLSSRQIFFDSLPAPVSPDKVTECESCNIEQALGLTLLMI